MPKSLYRKLNNSYRQRQSEEHTDLDKAQAAIGEVDEEWRERIDDVLRCRDNDFIPRHEDAGKLDGGWITMHNGLRVGALSYYGGGNLNMLVENKGVHEPQEERAFATVLPLMKPGSVILELGAYWAFYSMWFAKEVPDARCYLVEPDMGNLLSGKENFRENGLEATCFEQAYLGDKPGVFKDGVPIIHVDGFCERHGIEHIGMLHADIQAAELKMLHGASRMLGEKRVDYIFLSSHGNEMHYKCMDQIKAYGYDILASCDEDETASLDGLIVARRSDLEGPDKVEVSHLTAE